MPYLFLADCIVILHLLFILFATLGGFLVLKWRHWAKLHLPAAAWATALECFGWSCPLTPLENWLRRQGGADAYESGFIEHYILPVLYPAELTRGMQVGMGLFVVVINLVIYGWVWRRKLKG